MNEKAIEQLWYTWSDIGIEDAGLGFQVRAASAGLNGLQWSFYQSVKSYAVYSLPVNVDPDTINAPVCLALITSPIGKLLIHKVHVQRDRFGRSGNYFAHMLYGLSDHFYARDAIRLWNSPIWQTHDIPESEQSVHLKPLYLDDLLQTNQSFNFTEVQEQLHSLIRAFLASSRLRQRISITGTSEQIAALIWGLTHSVPRTLLPADFTFATYKCDIHAGSETILGTTTEYELNAYPRRKPVVEYMPDPDRFIKKDLEAYITQFADFAVQCLMQTSNGRSSELERLVEQAENDRIVNPEEYVELFRQVTVSSAQQTAPGLLDRDASVIQASRPFVAPSSLKQISPSESLHPLKHQPTTEVTNRSSVSAVRSNNIFDLRTQSFQRGGQWLAYRSNKVFFALASIIILLLFSNLLTFRALSTVSNKSSTVAPAVTEAEATLMAKATNAAQLSVKATMQAENGVDKDKIIGYAVSSPVTLHNSFTIYMNVENVGSSTWSDERGYQLVCIPTSDSDCKDKNIQGFMGHVVLPNHSYILSIALKAALPLGKHHVLLSLAYQGLPFGPQQEVFFSVQA